MKACLSILSSAFGIIKNWKNYPKLITKVIENESDGIAFAHIEENKKEKYKNDQASPCHKNMFWHYSHSCPKDDSDTQMLLDVKKVEQLR